MDCERETLKRAHLYDLRRMGREVGVKAPAALKKNELINQILAVKRGEIPPHFTNKGRMPKPTDSVVSSYKKFKDEKRDRLEKRLDRILGELKDCILKMYLDD